MMVGQGFGVWGLCRCVRWAFVCSDDAGSALLGGGSDAFATCFFVLDLFLTALAGPMGLLAWLNEDMMMAILFFVPLLLSRPALKKKRHPVQSRLPAHITVVFFFLEKQIDFCYLSRGFDMRLALTFFFLMFCCCFF